MRERSLLLMLAGAVLTAGALAQEIVIEPTNGRAPAANQVSRSAAEPAPKDQGNAATKRASKPTSQESSATRPTRKVPAKQVAARMKPAPAQKKASVSPAAEKKVEVAKAAPPPKIIPARPEWAMADTRDDHSLQTEIASALAHEPMLADSTIQVDVDDKSVTLEGRAAGEEEHRLAQRLAHSYAWNRKLVDHIAVAPKVTAQK